MESLTNFMSGFIFREIKVVTTKTVNIFDVELDVKDYDLSSYLGIVEYQTLLNYVIYFVSPIKHHERRKYVMSIYPKVLYELLHYILSNFSKVTYDKDSNKQQICCIVLNTILEQMFIWYKLIDKFEKDKMTKTTEEDLLEVDAPVTIVKGLSAITFGMKKVEEIFGMVPINDVMRIELVEFRKNLIDCDLPYVPMFPPHTSSLNLYTKKNESTIDTAVALHVLLVGVIAFEVFLDSIVAKTSSLNKITDYILLRNIGYNILIQKFAGYNLVSRSEIIAYLLSLVIYIKTFPDLFVLDDYTSNAPFVLTNWSKGNLIIPSAAASTAFFSFCVVLDPLYFLSNHVFVIENVVAQIENLKSKNINKLLLARWLTYAAAATHIAFLMLDYDRKDTRNLKLSNGIDYGVYVASREIAHALPANYSFDWEEFKNQADTEHFLRLATNNSLYNKKTVFEIRKELYEFVSSGYKFPKPRYLSFSSVLLHTDWKLWELLKKHFPSMPIRINFRITIPLIIGVLKYGAPLILLRQGSNVRVNSLISENAWTIESFNSVCAFLKSHNIDINNEDNLIIKEWLDGKLTRMFTDKQLKVFEDTFKDYKTAYGNGDKPTVLNYVTNFPTNGLPSSTLCNSEPGTGVTATVNLTDSFIAAKLSIDKQFIYSRTHSVITKFEYLTNILNLVISPEGKYLENNPLYLKHVTDVMLAGIDIGVEVLFQIMQKIQPYMDILSKSNNLVTNVALQDNILGYITSIFLSFKAVFYSITYFSVALKAGTIIKPYLETAFIFLTHIQVDFRIMQSLWFLAELNLTPIEFQTNFVYGFLMYYEWVVKQGKGTGTVKELKAEDTRFRFNACKLGYKYAETNYYFYFPINS